MLIDDKDPLWPRVATAFAWVQGPVPNGLTRDEFVKNQIMEYIKGIVKAYEAGAALEPTVDEKVAAALAVESDFGKQIVVSKQGV